MKERHALGPELEAVIFDLDGVVTDTASVHAAAWTKVFDAFLRAEAVRRRQGDLLPFSADDYLDYVDGKPRYDGVASFLAARRIELPFGRPSDPPGHRTICAIGNEKDREFEIALRDGGVHTYPTTVTLLRSLRAAGVRTAVVSSSRHLHAVVDGSQARGLFDAAVSGIEATELGLAGKPDPAIFLEAARRLGVRPAQAAVIEDAVAGVEAGHRGGFRRVIGVNRTGRDDRAGELSRHGADLVVDDLGDLVVAGEGRAGPG